MPISIIIPAHNEAAVIGRCLSTLLRGAAPGELEIIVVANGCKDDTAAVARSGSPDVKVIETPTPGKSNAINVGDAAATGFPRFYVDADVTLEISAIRRVAQVLRGETFLAAAPRVSFDLSDRNWFVRAFYDIWQRTPYIAEGMIGSGVYAVSEKGRQRWDKIPAITADDAYVRLQFKPSERTVVSDCTFTIKPPTSLAGLVKIKTRGHFGNIELKKVQPELFKNEGESHASALPKLARNPLLWPKLAVYLYVRVKSRKAAWKRLQAGDHKTWERDDSSRLVANVKPE
jgi:glycosyltransferase involved in cell wall biosynthesis